MAIEERNLELSPPADPRSLWPVIRTYSDYPLGYTVTTDGLLRTWYVLGVTPDSVVVVRDMNLDQARPDLGARWHITTFNHDEIFADPNLAQVHGLVSMQAKLETVSKGLTAILASAGVLLKKKK